MKKLLVVIVTAATAVAAYFLVKSCACSNDNDEQMSHIKKQRHLTNAFSKAKQYIASSNTEVDS